MWFLDVPQIRYSNESLLYTSSDPDDDYYSKIVDDRRRTVNQSAEMHTKTTANENTHGMKSTRGFDNQAFQPDSEYDQSIEKQQKGTKSISGNDKKPLLSLLKNPMMKGTPNYYEIWEAKSSSKADLPTKRTASTGCTGGSSSSSSGYDSQLSPPPLPPRALKKLMHERRKNQLVPLTVLRAYKPKNVSSTTTSSSASTISLSSSSNLCDDIDEIDSLTTFDYDFNNNNHAKHFHVKSSLDVRLLGIPHSDGSLSDCLDLCTKPKNSKSLKKTTESTNKKPLPTPSTATATTTTPKTAVIASPKKLFLNRSESLEEFNSSSAKNHDLLVDKLNSSLRIKCDRKELPFCEQILSKLNGESVNDCHVVNDDEDDDDEDLLSNKFKILPPNWEARIDSYGRIFYINHETKTTTWTLSSRNFRTKTQKTKISHRKEQLEKRYECIKRILRRNGGSVDDDDDDNHDNISSGGGGGSSSSSSSSGSAAASNRQLWEPHPALKFLCHPDFFSVLHLNQKALNIYTNKETAIKAIVNRIRKDVHLFEKYQHYRDFVNFMNCFADPNLELPINWQCKTDEKNNNYFIDSSNKTSYIDPRLLPNDTSPIGNFLAPTIQPRLCSSSNSSVSSSSSDISQTVPSGPAAALHPYNEQVVAFLRQLNIIDILRERYAAISKSTQLRENINAIRIEGETALNRLSNDLQLAVVLNLFEEEIMSYVPYPPPQLPIESGSNDHPNTKFEVKLRNFYTKLDSKGYGKGPLKLKLNIRRDHLLEDSFREIMSASKKELQKGSLLVNWCNEECLDQGGPSRELFFLLSRELFNPYHGLFEYSASGVYTVQISPMSSFVDNYHDWFRFCGRVLGLALINKYLLDVYFVRPIYKKLLQMTTCLNDLQSCDPEFYQSLQWIKDNNLSELTQPLDLSFVVTEELFGQIVERELKPDGKNILVTEQNKTDYLERMVKWRLERGISDQFNWFVQGFYDVVDLRLISMFDDRELELMLAGTVELDINDWQKYTEYRGYQHTDQTIQWFWQAVNKFTNEQRLRLLQFVTGTSSIPYEGFCKLRGTNGIRYFCVSNGGSKNQLPRARTCFNRLELPPYPSYTILYDKLLMAIEETNTFGLQ